VQRARLEPMAEANWVCHCQARPEHRRLQRGSVPFTNQRPSRATQQGVPSTLGQLREHHCQQVRHLLRAQAQDMHMLADRAATKRWPNAEVAGRKFKAPDQLRVMAKDRQVRSYEGIAFGDGFCACTSAWRCATPEWGQCQESRTRRKECKPLWTSTRFLITTVVRNTSLIILI
jgi:hypothetical protein